MGIFQRIEKQPAMMSHKKEVLRNNTKRRIWISLPIPFLEQREWLFPSLSHSHCTLFSGSSQKDGEYLAQFEHGMINYDTQLSSEYELAALAHKEDAYCSDEEKNRCAGEDQAIPKF